MPKPFMIGIEIEEVALGSVVRKLNSMRGIVALHMDFDKPAKRGPGRPPTNGAGRGPGRPPENASQPPRTFATSGQQAVIDLLKSRKPVSLEAIRAAFVKQGRSPKSLNSVIWNLLRDGTVVRTERNMYALKSKKDKKAKAVKKGAPSATTGESS